MTMLPHRPIGLQRAAIWHTGPGCFNLRIRSGQSAVRPTPEGSRAVATGGASRRSGTRNPWEGVFSVLLAPEGRWTAILRPAGAGGLRRPCSTGSVRLWRTPPVATTVGPAGAATVFTPKGLEHLSPGQSVAPPLGRQRRPRNEVDKTAPRRRPERAKQHSPRSG